MLANKLLVLAVCGMGVIEPVMAEDQPTGAQYSPVVRMDDACLSLRKHFDGSFSCAQVPAGREDK